MDQFFHISSVTHPKQSWPFAPISQRDPPKHVPTWALQAVPSPQNALPAGVLIAAWARLVPLSPGWWLLTIPCSDLFSLQYMSLAGIIFIFHGERELPRPEISSVLVTTVYTAPSAWHTTGAQ